MMRLWLSIVLCAAAGCTVRPVPGRVDPPVALPHAFSSSGDAAQAAHWWKAFGDQRLNDLIDTALQGSFTLRRAWDRLDQARALAARSGAALWPTLTGSAEASRTVVKNKGADRAYATEYSLGLAASYEVDLWGRVRATQDAAALDALATQEDLHAAAITLAAEVTATWYQLIEQRRQIALLDDQLATNRKYLDIITLQFRKGKGSLADVLQQRQLLESTQGDRVLAASAARVLEHRLAVLLGRPPAALRPVVPAALPLDLPPLPATGVPAKWIRRRPDVRAAEIRVRAADRSVAAAIADRFPTLSLSGRAETAADSTADIFNNWLASVAAGLTAPLLDGGLRRAEVRRTKAVLSERLNAYGETVLTSLREVEDALTQEARQAEYVASLRKQLGLSKQATERTRDGYSKGTIDFTRYLTTLLAHQRLQRTVLQAQRQLIQFRIDLYRALAGGWTPKRPAPQTALSRNTRSRTTEER